jgi:hypothetical protein
MSNIAIARDQKILLVRETTRGVLAYPATGGSAVVTIAAGYGSMNQNPNFTDSDEVRNSRDVLDRFVDARPAGSWSFPAYIRPSGAAGTAPQDDVLYESFFGAKTVNAGVSVAYSQQLEKPSFSMWFMQDHVLRFAKGCTVSSLGLSINNTGGVTQNWSGGLMWMGWCGTDNVKSDGTTSDNKFIVNNPKLFEVGARIHNVTAEDDNTGAGYEITAVDYTTGEITLGDLDSVVWTADDVIAPFLPAATEVGEPLASRLTTIDFGADTSKRIQTMNITLNDPVQYIEDELSSDGCPTEYMEQVRDYGGTVTLYLRKADVKYFYEGFNDTELAVAIKFGGDVAGKKATLNLSHVSIAVPEVATNAPAVNMSIGIKALGSTGEDSATLTFA